MQIARSSLMLLNVLHYVLWVGHYGLGVTAVRLDFFLCPTFFWPAYPSSRIPYYSQAIRQHFLLLSGQTEPYFYEIGYIKTTKIVHCLISAKKPQ